MIDLSQMNLLKMPERRTGGLEVKVDEKGQIKLGACLTQKLMNEEGKVFIKYYYLDDYRTIAIQKGVEGDVRFPKSGTMKHREYANKLETQGYKLPARYKIEWDDESQVWVGELLEVCPAPVMTEKRKRGSRKIVGNFT